MWVGIIVNGMGVVKEHFAWYGNIFGSAQKPWHAWTALLHSNPIGV
jgi:hypothetical protein